MAELLSGQFEFNGVTFGEGTNIVVSKFDTGQRSTSSPETDRPGADGQIVGPEQTRGAQWLIHVSARNPAGPPHVSILEPLAGAWLTYPEKGTTTPAVLRYRIPGKPTRRAYGRPRDIPLADEDALRNGLTTWGLDAVAAFKLTDPYVYTDAEEQITLPQDGSASVTTAGSAPSPFRLLMGGPFTSMTVTGYGWQVGLTLTVPAGRTVAVDTRYGTATFTDNGQSVAGSLSLVSSLAGRLQPGAHTVTVSGTGRTAATTSILKWRDGWVLP